MTAYFWKRHMFPAQKVSGSFFEVAICALREF